MAISFLPCPFCGSRNIDLEGWVSTTEKGPACDDCGGSAQTIELWNSRPVRMARAAETITWAVQSFGQNALLPRERMLRFLEEAIELGHSSGIMLAVMLKLIIRIYDKMPGSRALEFAQTAMTLDALGAVLNFDPDKMAAAEFERIKAVPIEERHESHRRKIDAGIAL